jgi:hypothetical protein
MEIIYYTEINMFKREQKYAEFNGVKFGYSNKYYYALKNDKGYKYLHHAVYMFYNNLTEIPQGYVIHHIDENKLNNDISNLKLLTNAEHISIHFKDKKLSNERKIKLSNSTKGHIGYTKGIIWSDEIRQKISNTMKGKNKIKFTIEQTNKIIEYRNNGMSYKNISKLFNVSAGTIKRVVKENE